MLEVALTIGIFFALVFGILWISLTIRAHTVLITSLADSLRFGVTRGQSFSFKGGHGPIPMLDQLEGEDASFENLRLRKLLYHRAKPGDDDDDFDFDVINEFVVRPVFPGRKLTDLPRTYRYTLAYMHEFMALRLGRSFLKYPCDDQPDCLGCKFVNPDSIVTAKVERMAVYEGDVTFHDGYQDRIGMRCTYNANFGPVAAMMRMLTTDDNGESPLKMKVTLVVNRARDR